MKFEWDPEKDRRNQAKHGVAFEEAATVFGDRFALSWEDREHSVGEYRKLTLGYTERQRLVIVAQTERDDRTRIISARLATAAERRLYESE
ncbi:MAG: BrnT family toxin [Thermoanaerobaculia bacterium]